MRELTTEEQRGNLINDLLMYTKFKEALWEYHPENPDRVQVLTRYNQLEEKIKSIEEQIASL